MEATDTALLEPRVPGRSTGRSVRGKVYSAQRRGRAVLPLSYVRNARGSAMSARPNTQVMHPARALRGLPSAASEANHRQLRGDALKTAPWLSILYQRERNSRFSRSVRKSRRVSVTT